MADARAFLLVDATTGAPLTSATPTFVDYRDINGTSRAQPSVTHNGGGVYVFTPSNADESAQTIALLDGGSGALPRYTAFAIHLANNSNQFWAWHVEDVAGALWTGAAPTVGEYRDAAGASRTPPSILSISGAYLFALVPTSPDVTAETNVRIDLPAGASQAYLTGDAMPAVTGGGGGGAPASPTTGVNPEAIASSNLLKYLRLYLPRKMVELNALRAPSLLTPGVGTGNNVGWLIPTGATLTLATGRSSAATVVTLPMGAAVTAAAIVAAITSAAPPGITASVDYEGRVVLTGVAPTTADSVLEVRPDSSGGNAALGFDRGGETVAATYISPPTWRSVMDGHPVTLDARAGFAVILGDRESRPWPSPGADIRRNETDVSFVLEVYRPETNRFPHRSRDAIQACVRAVREVLQSDDGRMLGRGQVRDIVRVDVTGVKISGRPFSFTNRDSPNVLFDVAMMTVNVRTYQATS